jgi:hypothetical protein
MFEVFIYWRAYGASASITETRIAVLDATVTPSVSG